MSNLQVKHRIKYAIAIVCILTLCFSGIEVSADDDISDLEGITSDLQNQLVSINNELNSIYEEINTIKMKIEITNGEIKRTQDSLSDAQASQREQYRNMKDRIKYIYEAGNVSFIELLLRSKNIADFLNKVDFIQNISSYDHTMQKELSNISQQIKDSKETLEEQQASLSTLEKDVVAKQADLEAKAAATQTDLEAYTAQLEQKRVEEALRIAAEASMYDSDLSITTDSGEAITVDKSELDVFAAILDCEALHDYNCMLAVATVVMNRYPHYGSIKNVVFASGQFEPVWTGKLSKRLEAVPTDLAYKVAEDALKGARLAAVANCYFFLYAPSTSRQGVNIGNNLFFPTW